MHQVRKRLKKTRAVLRLVRDSLGKNLYKSENVCFRDIGRSIATIRDAKVRIETLDNLSTHFVDTVIPDIFTHIRRELQIDYRQEYQRVFDEGILITVKNQLIEAKNRIDDWTVASDDWAALDSSIKRVYKRGYKGLHQSMSEPSVKNLHQWRKRVKYLRYQLRILRPIWPEMMEQLIDRTHDLSDYLGEDHDLATLKAFISQNLERFTNSSPENQTTLNILMALIDGRRQQLQTSAMFLGQRIYTESPRDFVDRLAAYWQVLQKQNQHSLLLTNENKLYSEIFFK